MPRVMTPCARDSTQVLLLEKVVAHATALEPACASTPNSRGDCPSFEPLIQACVETVLLPSAESLMALKVLRLPA